jgi:glycosyltransferase involved in cell wall biosynthesis
VTAGPALATRVSDSHPDPQAGSGSVAIFLWGNEIEDFLDTVEVSLAEFCTEFTGSYVFSFAAALREAGARPVIFCTSRAVATSTDFVHEATGLPICVIPSTRIYRALRRTMQQPYGFSVREMFGTGWITRRFRPLLIPVRAIALYLPTPPLRLASALRRYGCTSIICQEYEYPRFDICLLVGKILGVPVFATFQGGTKHRSRIEGIVRPLTVSRASGFIIASRSEADRVRRTYPVDERKLLSIPNPIDLRHWYSGDTTGVRDELGIGPRALVVAWHGRVSLPQKGLDVLLDAWERVCQERPGRELCLLLIGTGESAAEVRAQIAQLEAGRVVWIDEFTSDRPRLRRLLAAADLYVFPSRHEGFALAPLEAMACGLPVVATDAPGILELLGDGASACGTVVPAGDVAPLASALGQLIDDPVMRIELGKRARERSETEFSERAIGFRLREALESARLVGTQDQRRMRVRLVLARMAVRIRGWFGSPA